MCLVSKLNLQVQISVLLNFIFYIFQVNYVLNFFRLYKPVLLIILSSLHSWRPFKRKLSLTRGRHLRVARSRVIVILTVLSPWINLCIHLPFRGLSDTVFTVLLKNCELFWQSLVKHENFVMIEKCVVKKRNFIVED